MINSLSQFMVFAICVNVFLVSSFVTAHSSSLLQKDNDSTLPSSGISSDSPLRGGGENRRRRLQHRPYYYWYSDGEESLETVNGVLPTLSCPLGSYRDFGNRHLRRPGGLRMEGCIECPKGRYGSSTRLKNSLCTAPCPRGTYRDKTGGTSAADCTLCPEGTYGDEEGLTTKECSGYCTDFNSEKAKYYSDDKGLQTRRACKVCPKGYRGWQCEYPLFMPSEIDHIYERDENGILPSFVPGEPIVPYVDIP
mmetsp:Transcript_2528/g.3619  ORF Transcript_2528/g.3619 Transcript_2528/m.3619 type:complete len:251 (+) Transcript_2528:189-941(+)